MKNNLLIPNKFKLLGWILFSIFLLFSIYCQYSRFQIPGFQIYDPLDDKMNFSDYNLTNELAYFGTILGLLLICFSREKHEDELINALRLNAFQWAILANYIVLLILIFSSYGLGFVFIITYNSLTVLIVFIMRFYYGIFKLNRTNEK